MDVRQSEKTNGGMQIDDSNANGDLDHDLASKKLDEENRNRTPLKYCVLIAENPKKAFG